MAFVNAKTGKKIKLDTGYTSNPIDYQTWKRQQEAKRAEGQPSARPASAVSSPAKDAGKAKRDTSAATAIKAPVQRWENQLRQAQVDQDTDVILRLNKKLKEERARNPSSGGYSLSQGVADIFKKGANQVAQAGANTLALAEDVVNAPFELFSGMELGSLRNSGQGIFNPLREKVQKEGTVLAEKSAENVRKGGKGAALLDKYGTATVAAVPQSVIAMLTGGTSTAAQAAAQTSAGVARQAAEALSPGIARTLQTVAGNLSRDPQFWSSFSQVVGSGYQEALEDGASVPKAALYAVGNGLMNAAVEVGGGVQTLPGELQAGASGWRALVDSALDEGKEEVVQGVIERAMQNLAYQKKNPLASVKNPDAVFNPLTAAEEFAGGAVVGGILSGGQIAANRVLSGVDAHVRGTLDMMQRAAGLETAQKAAQAAPGARQASGAGVDTAQAQSPAEAAQMGPTGAKQTAAPPAGETTVNENGLTALSQLERENLSSGKRNKVVSTFSEAVDFVRNALRNKQMVDRAYLGKVPDSVAKAVLADTGIDIRGYGAIINGNDVRHIIRNHGDPLMETAKGQIRVTPEDIAKIPEILSSPDKVYLSDTLDGKGRKALVFEKQIGDKLITLQGVADGKKALQTDTLYIQKRRARTARDTMPGVQSDTVPVINAQSEPPQSSSIDFTISQRADSVKPEGIMEREIRRLFGGGKRLSPDALTAEQLAAVEAANGLGTMDMDAENRLYQVNPEEHIDRRDIQSAGDKRLRAFQFDHPQLHPYYVQAAQVLSAELEHYIPGGETASRVSEDGNAYSYRMSRSATPRIAELIDRYGVKPGQIGKAIEAIINDRGQENYAAAKRLELMLDEMLTNGYQDALSGEAVQPNREYVELKGKIAGATDRATDTGHGLDGLGAADAGFTTRGMEGQERTSRMAQSMPYNKTQEYATAMTKDEYNRLFRYQSQTEAKTTHLAEELVYVIKDGKKTFLKDVNEAQYNALLESLRDAAAWTPEQMDAARMILNELAGKSVNMDIASEEYTDWLKEVRQHETVGGQAVQAIAKWTRENRNGRASEMDALKALEKSGLSQEEQGRIYSRIVQLDNKINAVEAGDTAAMKSLILETAADRGLIRGRRGELLSLWASKALDAMTFDQMKQFAFSSTAAMSSDASKADLGQMVKTCQVLSMLSNKATVNRNLVGNASFYGVDALAMDGAALLDMAVSKATGTRSVAMERLALSPQALQDALRAAWISQAEVLLDVDMGGEKTRYGTGSNRTFKAGSKHAAARFLSALERNQALFLTVPDEFFKGMARGNAAATQKLIDQGKIKTDNANYAAEQADALAKYRTFQDNTKIANAIQTVHDICNMLVGFGDSGRTVGGHKVHTFGMGDFVAAFTKVAGNLATRGVEYSPHNAVKGTLELVQQIHNAKTGKTVDAAKQAKGVSNVARGLTGAAIACVFRGLIRAGVLRLADDDDDKNVAALNRSEGLDGVQLNLSAAYRWLRGEKDLEPQTGDTLIDASSLEPINQLMYAAAYLEDGLSLVSAYPAASLSSAAELPVLDTVGNIGKRVYKYGENIADVTAEELGRTTVSSVIPNAFRAAARGLDDRSRNSSVNFDDVEEKDPVRRFLNIMLEAAGKQTVASVPKLREQLPGGVSPIGEDKTYPTTQLWNLMNAVANPLGVNTYTQTEQSKEWQRLREDTGRADFYPSSTIPKTIRGGGLEKKLSYEERQDFQRERGAWLMPVTMQMMGNQGYQTADRERQSDLMADVRDFSHDAAKISVLGEDGAPKWVQKTIRAQQETGLSPAAVIYYRDMLSREKEKLEKQDLPISGANKTVRDAIFSDKAMSTPQKNALDDLMLTDGFYIEQDKKVDYSDEDSFQVSQMSDSAVKYWPLVHKNMPGITGEQYGIVYDIYSRRGTKEEPYTQERKKKDLQQELGLSYIDAAQMYELMKNAAKG